MIKRIVMVLFVLFIVLNFSFTSQAQKVDLSKYEIIYPTENVSSSIERNILINGKAPTGSTVNIYTYVTTDLTKKNFNLSRLPEDNDYINTDTIELISGNMCFFQHEISLVLGINKIVLDFGIDELSPKEFIIYVYDNTTEVQNLKKSSQKKITELVPNLK